MAQSTLLTGSRPTFPLLTEGKVPINRDSGRLDTVGFAFRISSSFDVVGTTMTVMGLGTDEERRSYRRKLDGGGFAAMGMGGKCWVEASLPKRLDGENVVAVSVGDGLEVMREMYAEAVQFCKPVFEGEDFELSEVVRLDAVLDFQGVHHSGELLSGLANTPRPGVQKVKLFQDPERNKADTLTVGPKAWHMTGYDKHQESKGVAPEGQLRTETRLHKVQLTSDRAKREGYTMRHIGDMTSGKVEQAHRSTFELACFDREVVGVASVASAIQTAEWLSDVKKMRLWTYLTMPGAARMMSKNHVTEYRRLARELGVTPQVAIGELPDIRVRLDYESGTEVCRVA